MFAKSEVKEVKSIKDTVSRIKLVDVIREQKNLFQLPHQEFIKIIQSCIPEVNFLNESAEVSAEVSKVQNLNFYGLKEPEAIRAFAGLLCFRDVMSGTKEDYEYFIECHKAFNKPPLSFESFSAMKTYIVNTFKTPEDIAALMWSILCNDLGKVISLQEKYYGCKIENVKQKIGHDAILVKLMSDIEKSNLFPGFKDLTAEHQNIIIHGYASDCDISQFEQLELPVSALAGLKSLSAKELDFYVAHTFYDVAGAAATFTASKNKNGYMTMHQETFDFFENVRVNLNRMKEEKLSIDDVYANYLKYRGERIGVGYADRENIALCRIAGLTRFAKPEQGELLKAAWGELKSSERAILTDELNVHGVTDKRAIFVGYGVAMFINTMGKMVGLLKETVPAPSPEQIKTANKEGLKIVLSMLAQVYDVTRKKIGDKPNPDFFVAECYEIANALNKQNPRNMDWRITLESDRRIDFAPVSKPELQLVPVSPKTTEKTSAFGSLSSALLAAPKPLLPKEVMPTTAQSIGCRQ